MRALSDNVAKPQKSTFSANRGNRDAIGLGVQVIIGDVMRMVDIHEKVQLFPMPYT